jgi:short-subunit dehydrogenase
MLPSKTQKEPLSPVPYKLSDTLSGLSLAFGQTAFLVIAAGLSGVTLLFCALINAASCSCCRTRVNLIPTSILITGATGGLGEELSLQYARRLKSNVSLALTGRNAEALARVADACREFGAHVRTKRVDVLAREELATWIKEVDVAAPLDLIIANAGVTERTANIPEDDIEGGTRATFATNVDGVFNTVFPALPMLRERRRGQVAVISSLASYAAFSIFDGYSASKAAVRIWSESLRHKLAREGVFVTCVVPGYISGAMTAAFAGKVDLRGIASQASSAERIIDGLASDEALIAFPTSTFMLATMLGSLPFYTRDALARSRLIKEIQYTA